MRSRRFGNKRSMIIHRDIYSKEGASQTSQASQTPCDEGVRKRRREFPYYKSICPLPPPTRTRFRGAHSIRRRYLSSCCGPELIRRVLRSLNASVSTGGCSADGGTTWNGVKFSAWRLISGGNACYGRVGVGENTHPNTTIQNAPHMPINIHKPEMEHMALCACRTRKETWRIWQLPMCK